jgi:HAD superfamily hydrolase (TIGR01509 family)
MVQRRRAYLIGNQKKGTSRENYYALDTRFIFDCDGVLVDSEALAIQIMLKALRPLGFQGDMDMWSKKYSGKLEHDIMASLQQDHGIEFPDDFYERTQRDMRAAFRRELQPIAGMPELIRGLPQAQAVVSNSNLDHVVMCMELCGLTDTFEDRLFSSEQVARPKPAPDLYEFAMQQLGLSKDEAWIVEDSVTGVEAAVGAGLRVIGFLGAGHISEGHAEQVLAAGATHTAADARDLQRLIGELIA